MPVRHFRSREASLWQSAADKVASQNNAANAMDVGSGAAIAPADPHSAEMAAVNAIASAVDNETAVPKPAATVDTQVLGVTDVARFCASAAFRLAQAKAKQLFTGDDTDVKKFQEELGAQFGTCDPKWAETIAEYLKTKAAGSKIPYRRHTNLADFVMEGPLGESARIALVGDWGTGETGARLLLRQIAQKKPDVVIHLGDVYYSGTGHEFQNYFYAVWQSMLGIPSVQWGGKLTKPSKPATFTLAGNHDMYAGGGPYYTTLDMIGQPASYFCLRNRDWQFIAMDTGLHDSDPTKSSVTFLEDSEVEWIKDKIHNAGGRKTVLLSHHQLFTTFEEIGGGGTRINQSLQKQLGDILPEVTVWYWGHEHDFVVYPTFMNVLARCIGHGAVPVGVGQIGRPDPKVPFADLRLSADTDGGLFQHGYAIMELKGGSAKVTHYQFDPISQDEVALFEEDFPAKT
jgi:3',5'-cyclic AMP phosphodiesterase CpdA